MVLGRSERTYLITPSAWVFCAFGGFHYCFYRASDVNLDRGWGGSGTRLRRGSGCSGGKGTSTPSWTEAVAPPNVAPVGALMARRTMTRRPLLSLGLITEAVNRTTAHPHSGRPV